MWYLIWSDDDNSYSIIHDKYVMNAGRPGEVTVNSKVTFFYGNKPYVGSITEMNEDRDVVDKMLTDLGSTAKRASKKVEEVRPSGEVSSGSRRLRRSTNPPPKDDQPPPKQKASGSNKPAVDFRNKRILELNRNTASLRQSEGLQNEIKKSKKEDKPVSDDDWSPDDEDKTLMDMINEKAENLSRRTTLVRGIKALDKDWGSSASSSSSAVLENVFSFKPAVPTKSPSKEELKQQIEKYRLELQRVSDNKSDTKKVEANLFNTSKPKPDAQCPESERNSPQQDDFRMSPLAHNEIHNENDSLNAENDSVNAENDSQKTLNTSATSLSSTDTDNVTDHDYELSKDQLFGEGEDMVRLNGNIFCKKDVLKTALSASTEVTHVARRLIEGVFKLEALKKCTLTGMPYRAGGKDKIVQVEGLNRTAVQTIISYAKEVGKMRHWPSVKTKAIRTSMTQRLGEIKRQKK